MAESLLNMTFAVTAGAGLLLLVKRALQNHTTARFQFCVWLILAAQILTFPLADALPASGVSLQNFLPSAVFSQELSDGAGGGHADSALVNAGARGAADAAGADSANDATLETPGKPDTAGDRTAPQTYFQENEDDGGKVYVRLAGRQFVLERKTERMLLVVWLLGIAALLTVQGGRACAVRRRTRRLPLCEDAETLRIFTECRETIGVRRAIALKTGAETTMLAGIVRPTVYIKEGFAKEELKYAFLHELSHEKHGDVLWSLAAAVCAAVFWFNPVIWIAFRTFRRDLEMYCDERVISALGSRREYARTLVNSAGGQNGFVLASTSFLGGEKEVTARVRRIAENRKPRAAFTAFAVLLAVLVLAACTTGALKDKSEMQPVRIGAAEQADVPAAWLDSMRTADGSGALPEGGKEFLDQNGEVFAELYDATSRLFTDEEYFAQLVSSAYPDFEEHHARLLVHLEERGFENVVGEELSPEELAEIVPESGAFDTGFVLQAEKDGAPYQITAFVRNYRIVLFIQKDEDSAAPLLAKDEALAMLASLRSIPQEDVTQTVLSDLAEIRLGEYDLPDETYRKYAETALASALAGYVDADLPVELAAADYTIDSMEEVKQESGSPAKPDVFLGAYYDDAIWQKIYPYAKIYRVSYTLTPERPEYFEGERTRERLAVFAVNDYVREEDAELFSGEPIGDFYFLGFLREETVALSGMDSAALMMLQDWQTQLNPASPQRYYTDYIGDAPTVAKVVAGLPLREYIDTSEGTYSSKALEIQTGAEPYGLTVRYNFGRGAEDRTDEIAMTPVSRHARQVLDSGMNAYLIDQVYKNIARIYDGIGNLGTLTVKMIYEEDGEMKTETIFYKDRARAEADLAAN